MEEPSKFSKHQYNYNLNPHVPKNKLRMEGFIPVPPKSLDNVVGRSPLTANKATLIPKNPTITSSKPIPVRESKQKRLSFKYGRRAAWEGLQHKKKKIAKRLAIVLLIFVVVIGGWLGYKIIRNGLKIFNGSNLLGLLSSTKLRGEDKGRVNILLAGTSEDDPHHDGADLTDSIMLISVDTNSHKAFLLSIPRDLWVKLPGYNHQKINAANHYGNVDKFNEDGYAQGGIGLLEKVISEDFRIPIHYYAKVDYTAFRDSVNAVGGIDVTINSVNKNGLYDPNIGPQDHGPLRLRNGTQHLDGQTALNLARARGDSPYSYGFPASDFDRTMHQRQMMVALKDKALSSGVLSNPDKLSNLLDAIGNHVKTDLKPSEVRRLYDIGKQIGSSSIQSVSMGDLLTNYQAADGELALRPIDGLDDFTSIQNYLNRLIMNDPTISEKPTVIVLNGSNAYGVAKKEAAILTSRGFNVIDSGNASHIYANSLFVDKTNGGKPGSKSLLQKVLSANVTITGEALTESQGTKADFVVIVGSSAVAGQ
ncbi:MAG: hypothetical protein NVSMB46_08920 [Candidatus Saccharimonadales bacterium]